MVFEPSSATRAATAFEYFAAAGAQTFAQTSRQIRVGGAGDLYILSPEDGLETLFAADVLAGERFNMQCDGLGASSTCTKITVLYN